jgi:lipid-A-disaccharide synthase-like uncharacterized protein
MEKTLLEFNFLWWHVVVTAWKIMGVSGALMFSARWLVQAYYSRKAGKPVTPRMFWILSVVGSWMMLGYFTLGPKPDMVGVASSIFPSFIAAYNLYLDLTYERRMRDSAALAAKAALPKIEPQPSGRHAVPTLK